MTPRRALVAYYTATGDPVDVVTLTARGPRQAVTTAAPLAGKWAAVVPILEGGRQARHVYVFYRLKTRGPLARKWLRRRPPFPGFIDFQRLRETAEQEGRS